MKLRNLLSRSKTKNFEECCRSSCIICESQEIETLIKKWTENEKWKFENFADFLDLVGISTPVVLSNLVSSNTFTCREADGKECTISLFFGDWWDFCSEIHVTINSETLEYYTNSNLYDMKSTPNVTLKSRIIRNDNKKLKSYYSEYFCHRTLNLYGYYELEVNIYEPSMDNSAKVLVLQNRSEIENYLFSLCTNLTATEVFKEVITLLGFTQEHIKNCSKILISYHTVEVEGKPAQEIEKYYLEFGKVLEHTAREDNGEIITVRSNGNLTYLAPNVRIDYQNSTDTYDIVLTGSKKEMNNFNLLELIEHLETQASKKKL